MVRKNKPPVLLVSVDSLSLSLFSLVSCYNTKSTFEPRVLNNERERLYWRV
jgi:hypothetical protein